MSDPYDFEDVRMDVSADVAGSSPPACLSVAVGPPLGTLFKSSPASVASEVTRGERGNEGVRLLLVRHVGDVCGGEIKGGGSVVRFCSIPRDACDVASHAKHKALIRPDCLYPRVPKKGNNQVRLEPALPLSLIPPDETLEVLLLEEKPITLWQTYMDYCKASEGKTGRNERGDLSTGGTSSPDWEHVEAPSLQDLSDADDFKTPKKVRFILTFTKEVDEEVINYPAIGTILPLDLDLSRIPNLEGLEEDTPTNRGLCRILVQWNGLTDVLGRLKNCFLSDENISATMRENVVAQFVEFSLYMNELGNKSRLLSARIGRDGRPEQAEASVWETLNIIQEEADQAKEEMMKFQTGIDRTLALVSANKEVPQMKLNMEKLAIVFKKSMFAINERLIRLETQADTGSGSQKRSDHFDFSTVSPMDTGARTDVDGQLRKLQDKVGALEEEVRKRDKDPGGGRGSGWGGNSEHVQWGTFRKARSVVTNISQAGVAGLGDSVGAYERNRTWISQVSTHQFWYSRFMHGVHKRVGEVRKPDEIITIDVLHIIDKILEGEWKAARGPETKRRVCELGAWMMGGFCTGLRGEEMLLIDMFGTATSIQRLMKDTAPDPHFKLVVIGRTKRVQQDGKAFGIPCVKVTHATGLRPGVWVQRLVDIKQVAGGIPWKAVCEETTTSQAHGIRGRFL